MTDNSEAPQTTSRLRQILQDLARLEHDRAVSEAAAVADRAPLPTSARGQRAAAEASVPKPTASSRASESWR